VLSDSGKSIPAESFLSYEPYSEMEPQLLQELWDKDNKSNIISDTFLSKFVKISSSKLNWFYNIFSTSAGVPSSKDDLSHELMKWRDNKRTYKDFRHQLDKHSVFAGRNILVSVITVKYVHSLTIFYCLHPQNIAEYDCEASLKEEELQPLLDGNQISKLRVIGM
jgi:hypothetical protein